MYRKSMVNMATGITVEKWLENEAYDDIGVLRQAYENEILTKDELKKFGKRLRKELFGDKVVCRLQSFENFIDRKNVERIRVYATVMQPTGEGYEVCGHPLEEYASWDISAVIQANGFNKVLKKGTLFTSRYRAAYDNRHLSDIITLDLNTYEEINVAFSELLVQLGGPLLADAAEAHFGADMEKAMIAELLEVFQSTQDTLQIKQKQLAEQLEELAKRENAYQDRLQSLEPKEKEWVQLLARARDLMALESGFGYEEGWEGSSYPWNNETVVELLQSLFYHNSEDDLVYEESVIESFFRALQANILVILSGPSGTGKSSVVAAMARAIKGARAKFIPVQSSWTDTQDLLGYFNPIEKRYIATPFLEALADAKDDPNHLYLVCLDEMNLAHVEYYFSEFLSAREQKKPFIRLYSQRYFSDAQRLVESISLTENMSTRDRESYENALELTSRYPAIFTIPENVRFVGTLNMDYTVKPLSPKVIDRSLVIELKHSDHTNEIKDNVLKNVKFGFIEVELAKFTEQHRQEIDVEAEAKQLVALSEQLSKIPNVRLNSRGYKQLIGYLTRLHTVEEHHIDQLIYTKLLPRIVVSKRDESEVALLQDFSAKLTNYPLSHGKFREMLQGTRSVQFW